MSKFNSVSVPINTVRIFRTHSIAKVGWWSSSRTKIETCIIIIILSLNGHIQSSMRIVKHHYITIVDYCTICFPSCVDNKYFTIASITFKVFCCNGCSRAGSFVTTLVLWTSHPCVVFTGITQPNSLARLDWSQAGTFTNYLELFSPTPSRIAIVFISTWTST